MNDIDIEEGRALLACWDAQHDRVLASWCVENAAAMFDAIETGRQWETIARRHAPETLATLAPVCANEDCEGHDIDGCPEVPLEVCGFCLGLVDQTFDLTEMAVPSWLVWPCASVRPEALRDVADRTPGPHHDGGAG